MKWREVRRQLSLPADQADLGFAALVCMIPGAVALLAILIFCLLVR